MVGLSGGVDSSAAAALLVEQGHEVVGGYMKNWINEEGLPGDCPWESDLEDAHLVAKKLGIEFRVVDLIDHYRERIVNYLLEKVRVVHRAGGERSFHIIYQLCAGAKDVPGA